VARTLVGPVALAALSLAAQTPEAIIAKRCLPCHNNQLDNAGLSFENQATVLPKSAKILAAITHKGDIKMPPGPKLADQDIATLTAWINHGAPGLRASSPPRQQHPFELWTFDRLEDIAGYPTKVEGHPRVIDSPVGKAVEFNGVDDALFIEDHPLADAATFTWEVIFRPDKEGKAEQRFFHLQERDSKTGQDTLNRFLFEIRVTGDEWYLDSFVMSPTGSKTLLNTGHRHPLGDWYHVAQVYDGRQYRNYVNGVQENQGDLTFTANAAGHASAGVRINRRDYFKGAIAQSRFTRAALTPAEFLKPPPHPN
jgi:cytochrome c551/c552